MTIAAATPHETYEGLRGQFMALRTLAASQEAIASNLSKQLRDQTQTLADLEAERATNAQLTQALLAAEAERDQLKAENLRLHQDLGMWKGDGEACITNRDALRELLGLKPGENLHEAVEALRKDAERYRWLREASHFDTLQHQVFCKAYGDALDELIDQAVCYQEAAE